MNQQYMFQVSYYDFLIQNSPDNLLKKYNAWLTTEVEYKKIEEEQIPFTEHSFVLETQYPGMVIGLGYPHYTGRENGADSEQNNTKEQEEIKCGFTLDYVTGLPYWPGSSVKGTIRNAFETKIGDKYLVKEILAEKEIKLNNDEYNELVQEIFGSKIGRKGENLRGSDIFLDVVLAKPNQKNQVLGFDYITSHKLSTDDKIGLKEPNAVKILKILPQVQMLFRFRLKDSKICPQLTIQTKLELYQKLIMLFGAGAKTNTGYGEMKSVKKQNSYCGWLPVQKD